MCVALVLTSPRLRGEVGLRSNPGEGVQVYQLAPIPRREPLTPTLSPQERGEGAEQPHTPSSLNLSATRAAMASTAACASGPIAETTTEVPGPAASIINPMIEVPPTVSLPRVTQTSALKRSTIWTNLAEARACRPRLLMI